MTPKEKANDLMEKFSEAGLLKGEIDRCSIIAVHEIIDQLNEVHKFWKEVLKELSNETN